MQFVTVKQITIEQNACNIVKHISSKPWKSVQSTWKVSATIKALPPELRGF